jgi:hypothetical protein
MSLKLCGGFLKWDHKHNSSGAGEDGCEDSHVQATSLNRANEFRNCKWAEQEDGIVMRIERERERERHTQGKQLQATMRIAPRCRLPGHENYTTESIEQTVGTSICGVVKGCCSSGEGDSEDCGSSACNATYEEAQAHLHEKVTKQSRQPQCKRRATKQFH